MYVILGILALLAIYIILTFNALVALRNTVKEGFATMDVYLKKRWDLIPNLVETVKGYAKHESGVLETVVRLRNSSYDNMQVNDKINCNNQLTAGLSKLFALAENYPDLKASQNFSDLQAQLLKIEDDIANARKYFNAVVRNMNTKIESFPSNIVAKMFGFAKYDMYEAASGEKEAVRVGF